MMPGDLDEDLDMDGDDYDIFVDCLNDLLPGGDPCQLADLDESGEVDCGDWPPFVYFWTLYSDLELPALSECDGCLRGDFDLDGQVDLADFALFQDCFSGPGGGATGACECIDLDWDNDVDLADFGTFQVFFGTEKNP